VSIPSAGELWLGTNAPDSLPPATVHRKRTNVRPWCATNTRNGHPNGVYSPTSGAAVGGGRLGQQSAARVIGGKDLACRPHRPPSDGPPCSSGPALSCNGTVSVGPATADGTAGAAMSLRAPSPRARPNSSELTPRTGAGSTPPEADRLPRRIRVSRGGRPTADQAGRTPGSPVLPGGWGPNHYRVDAWRGRTSGPTSARLHRQTAPSRSAWRAMQQMQSLCDQSCAISPFDPGPRALSKRTPAVLRPYRTAGAAANADGGQRPQPSTLRHARNLVQHARPQKVSDSARTFS